jgi:hypothetical protein
VRWIGATKGKVAVGDAREDFGVGKTGFGALDGEEVVADEVER